MGDQGPVKTMKTLLSTRDVAQLMHVTETTIKRWSAEGKLPCVKTPGGHRKYRMKDILQFSDDQSYPLTGIQLPESSGIDREILEYAMFRNKYQPVSAIVLDRALHADRSELLLLLTYLTKHQITIATIGDQVIRPAMAAIGELWTEHRLEINQEHIASQALLEAVIRLSPDLRRKPSNGLSAVCACAESDHHEIGLRILSYALESEGWNIRYLGANTPFETLRSLVSTERPELLCFSFTLQPTETSLEEIRSIGALARSVRAAFIVSGASVGSTTLDDLSCDCIALSTQGAIDFVREQFHLKPGPKKLQAAPPAEGAGS